METNKTGRELRDEALIMLEEKRSEYISHARRHAHSILRRKEQRGEHPATVTSDDIWAIFPPPPDINPKVMGAIFSKSSGLEKIGYQQSKRKEAHARPIGIWTRQQYI